MSTMIDVPLTIAPDAAARVAELSMRAELEQMLEQTRHTIPDLQRIDVTLALPYDTGDETGITITATRKASFAEGDRTGSDWGRWFVNTFPPEVRRHFALLVHYEPADAR